MNETPPRTITFQTTWGDVHYTPMTNTISFDAGERTAAEVTRYGVPTLKIHQLVSAWDECEEEHYEHYTVIAAYHVDSFIAHPDKCLVTPEELNQFKINHH